MVQSLFVKVKDMAKFRTKYDERKPIFTKPGSGIKIEYQLKMTKDGPELVEIGKTDLYGYIQSHADSVDIHKILERCALMDDYSFLNVYPGTYADITDMPTSLAEAYSQIQDAKEMFDRMPIDIKESYGNNFVEFISDIGSERFIKVTEDYLKKISPEKVDEVKKDES